MTADLTRFLNAQATTYNVALAEIRRGRKASHWMWFIFPQLKGLGRSETAQFYGLAGLNETQQYLAHPVLGHRLIEISAALLAHSDKSAYQIFGTPDDLKLRSCMTLFATLPGAPPIYANVLTQFFGGEKDERTLALLGPAT